MDFSNELALNSVLSTFNDQFDNLHYFYPPGVEFTNLYILAGKKGTSKSIEGLQLKLNFIPKDIRSSVIKVLKNSNKFKKEDAKEQNIFYDEKNQYSIIFAKVLTKQRKRINFSLPSRILIN